MYAERVVVASALHSSLSSTITKTTATDRQLVMGCVCYDPAVDEIWNGIRTYLRSEQNVPFEYRLFDTYESQVSALLRGRIDVAWNGPLAHVVTEELVQYHNGSDNDSQQMHGDRQEQREVVSLGMRDVDRDFESVVAVRNDAVVDRKDATTTTSPLSLLAGLRLATGSSDSPQAHLVPMYYFRDVPFQSVAPLEADVGKHGDTAAGEVLALEALVAGKDADPAVDAATVSRMMWDRALLGLLPSIDPVKLRETCRLLESVRIPTFDHCQFDAILPSSSASSGSINEAEEKEFRLNEFQQALFSMDWNVPDHRRLLELEGIRKEWVGPRQSGYDVVRDAVRASSASAAPIRSARNFLYSGSGASNSDGVVKARSFSTSSGAPSSPPPKERSEPLNVAVIGAGVSGLQIIRALKNASGQDGIRVTAFEASSTVGGLWKSNYENFGVQVPKQLYEFQDYPMTEVEWGGYATGPQVQSYVENYADAFGLRDSIRFNTKVRCVEQRRRDDAAQDGDSASSWTVLSENTMDGTYSSEEFDYLVVATGLYSGLNKHLPPTPGRDVFVGNGGEIVHSSEFYDAAAATNKRVVVVGSGKSAADCAVEASKAGAKSVTLLQRTAHWPTPRLIAGIIPFQYVFLSRFGTALVSAHKGPFPGGSGPAINAFRNSIIGPLLMRPIFRAVEELFAFQFGLRGELRPKKDVVEDFYDVALVLDSELKNMRKAGKIDVRMGEVETFGNSGKSILLEDGSTLDAELVVSATGFSQDYSIFTDPATRTALGVDSSDDGLYLYRGMLPDGVPNLAFIGHVATISNISTYGLQAEWLARMLTGRLKDAGAGTVSSAEIDARKKWARSWMPKSANRGMNVLLHQTHYHDQLLRDMGIEHLRKSNPLAEYLMPYEPADYDGIMGGTLQRMES